MKRLSRQTFRNLYRSLAYGFLPTPVIRIIRYPKEFLFVNGYKSFNNEGQSVIFFTTHKCASVLMGHVLNRINREYLGLTHLNLPAYFWDVASESKTSVFTLLQTQNEYLFRDKGKLYAPIRDYVDISHLNDVRVVLMLRDPRDVLVSSYYSAKFSHRPPASRERRETFLRERERLGKLDIEMYVREQAPLLEERYRRYRHHIPHQQLITYEKMWQDFEGFSRQLGTLLGIELDNEFVTEISRKAQIGETTKEDIMSHRRKGTPGDYKNKLDSSTITELNHIFGETLRWMYGDEHQFI